MSDLEGNMITSNSADSSNSSEAPTTICLEDAENSNIENDNEDEYFLVLEHESGPDMRVAEMREAAKEKENEILHLMNTICMLQRERESISETADEIEQKKFEQLSEEFQTYQENTDKHIEDLQSLVEVKNKTLVKLQQELDSEQGSSKQQVVDLYKEVQAKTKENYSLLRQLTEERKKCVEMYKTETLINKEKVELSKENESLKSQIEVLTAELEGERIRRKDLNMKIYNLRAKRMADSDSSAIISNNDEI